MQLTKKQLKLFESIHTLPDIIRRGATHFGDRPVVEIREKDHVKSITYSQFQQDVNCMVSLLTQKAFPTHHIAIIGTFCYEWLVLFFGIVSSGNVAVLIDRSLNEKDTEELMRQGDVSALFIESTQTKKAIYLKSSFDPLETFTFDENKRFRAPNQRSSASENDFENICCFLGQSPTEKNIAAGGKPIHPHQTALIVFTSGTTGRSKAVLLSHKNICDDLCCSLILFENLVYGPGDKIIPFLPPHHMFQLTTGILPPLYYCATLCFGGGLKRISSDLKFFKPVMMIVVPMAVEGLYKKISIEISKKGKEKQMRRAVKLSKFLLLFKIDLRRKLFKDIHESLGGNMQDIICGGAFLEPSLVKSFNDWGFSLRNGYGITECSPVVACNMPKKSRAGSVGVIAPAPYCEVKIEKGEILVRGSIVMQGYYQDQEAMNEAFDDGWFRTGDLGYIDEDGFLFITGRKKHLIILSDGNNISPEELEIPLEKLPLVQSVLVDAKRYNNITAITAFIYPDHEYARQMEIIDIQSNLEREIAKINAELPSFKKIQKVEICHEDFEKTALGKIIRYRYTGISKGEN